MNKHDDKDYWPRDPSKYNLSLKDDEDHPLMVVLSIVVLAFVLAYIFYI